MPATAPRVLRRGFTLIELIVVVSIIGVLVALLIPSVQAAREAVRRMQCASHLRQVGLAFHNYAQSHGCFPPWRSPTTFLFNGSAYELGVYGWPVHIFPYIEQGPLYNLINFNVVSTLETGLLTYPFNQTASSQVVSALLCPSDPDTQHPFPDLLASQLNLSPAALSNMHAAIPFLPGGRFGAVRTLAEVTDGTSNTVAVGEQAFGIFDRDTQSVVAVPTSWIYGPSSRFDSPMNGHKRGFPAFQVASSFGSFHPGGSNFAFADGSVRFIRETINSWPVNETGAPVLVNGELPPRGIYQAIGTHNGGEVVSADAF